MKINNIAKRTIASAVAVCISATSLYAQDFRATLRGERKAVPIERDIRRPNSLTPNLLQPKLSTPELTVAELAGIAKYSQSIIPLDPVAWGDTIAITPYNGYASLGYFPSYNLGASAGYRLINNSRTRLGTWLQFDGLSYKPFKEAYDGLGDNKDNQTLFDKKLKSNTVAVGARLDQKFDGKGTLTARAGFQYSGITNPLEIACDSYGATDFGAGLQWWGKAARVNYHIDASVDRFAYNKTELAKETNSSFGGGFAITSKKGNKWGGAEIKADIFHRDNLYNDKTGAIIDILPYFAYEGNRFKGRFGARIDIASKLGGNAGTIAPEVLIDINPVKQFSIYLQVTGGAKYQSIREYFNYCQFSCPLYEYDKATVATGTLGFNFGPFGGFSAGLRASYTGADGYGVPTYFDIVEPRGIGYYLPVDLRAAVLGANIEYDWTGKVKGKVEVEYVPSKKDDIGRGYYLWRDNANLNFNAEVSAKPIENFDVTLGFNIRTKRHAFVCTSNVVETEEGSYNHYEFKEYDLKNLTNLHLSANYKITKQVGVFAKVENLLNSHYLVLPYIPAQGVKGLIGVNYNF